MPLFHAVTYMGTLHGMNHLVAGMVCLRSTSACSCVQSMSEAYPYAFSLSWFLYRLQSTCCSLLLVTLLTTG